MLVADSAVPWGIESSCTVREITFRSLPVYSCTSTMWSALIIPFQHWQLDPERGAENLCNDWSLQLAEQRRTDKRGGTEVIHANNTATAADLTFV